MIFGWVFCVTVGIVMVRLRDVPALQNVLLGKELWFLFHMTFMGVGWSCIVISYAIIFIYRDGWSVVR